MKNEKLVKEYLDELESKKQVIEEKRTDFFEYKYDSDPVLLAIRNTAIKIKQLGFEESAIAQLRDYVERFYPDKVDEELKLLSQYGNP